MKLLVKNRMLKKNGSSTIASNSEEKEKEKHNPKTCKKKSLSKD